MFSRGRGETLERMSAAGEDCRESRSIEVLESVAVSGGNGGVEAPNSDALSRTRVERAYVYASSRRHEMALEVDLDAGSRSAVA